MQTSPPTAQTRATPAQSLYSVSPSLAPAGTHPTPRAPPSAASVFSPSPSPDNRHGSARGPPPAPSTFAPSPLLAVNRHPGTAQPPLKYSASKPAPLGPSPNTYYQQPPARSRRPYKLYNKDCGVHYKSVAKLTKADTRSIRGLLNAEVFDVLAQLGVMYHCRNNTIPGPNQLSLGQIRGIFDCDLTDYQFSVNEIYKRYAMRKGYCRGRDVADLNFWNLANGEIERFMEYLDRLSKFPRIPDFKLWTFGKDDEGKWYLKIKANEITVNYFQLFNALHDSLYQWKAALFGDEWIEFAAGGSPFYIC